MGEEKKSLGVGAASSSVCFVYIHQSSQLIGVLLGADWHRAGAAISVWLILIESMGMQSTVCFPTFPVNTLLIAITCKHLSMSLNALQAPDDAWFNQGLVAVEPALIELEPLAQGQLSRAACCQSILDAA